MDSRGLDELADFAAHGFIPNPLPPQCDWRSMKADFFDEYGAAARALARLDGLERGVPDAGVMLRSLLFREARLSSKIEDIVTTAEDMALAAAGRGVDPRGPGSEAVNYVRALEHGVKSPLPFCVRLICEMHELLLRDVRGGDKRPGLLRDISVYIGDPELGPRRARFVPTPPGELLTSAMADLERFVNADSAEIPALVQIALMHYQFETIHPFRDGNGRIGRALISRELCARKFIRSPLVYVSGYIESHKRRYVDLLLNVSVNGDWATWIAYVLEAFRSQADAACVSCEKIMALHKSYVARAHSAKAPPRVFRLIDSLFSLPIVNALETAEKLGVSDPTARADIKLLTDIGVLTEITGRSWGKDWAAKDILAAIDAEVTP